MNTQLLQELANLDVEVITAKYVVVDCNSTLSGIDDNGDLIVNIDKYEQIQDTFCVLPKWAPIKVYSASSQIEMRSKLQAETPDLERTIEDEKIDGPVSFVVRTVTDRV